RLTLAHYPGRARGGQQRTRIACCGLADRAAVKQAAHLPEVAGHPAAQAVMLGLYAIPELLAQSRYLHPNGAGAVAAAIDPHAQLLAGQPLRVAAQEREDLTVAQPHLVAAAMQFGIGPVAAQQTQAEHRRPPSP